MLDADGELLETHMVVGILSPRYLEDIAVYIPELAADTVAQYARLVDRHLEEVSSKFDRLEVCVIDLDELREWCEENDASPGSNEARAGFVIEQPADSYYTYSGNIQRIFDAADVLMRVEDAYDDYDGDEDELSRELNDALSALHQNVIEVLQSFGATHTLASLEVHEHDEVLGLHYILTLDEEGDLCPTYEVDDECFSAGIHLGLLRGGYLWIRWLNEEGHCYVAGYRLEDRAWVRGSSNEVAAWRRERDATVVEHYSSLIYA